MDASGVPHKINRYVYKFVNAVSESGTTYEKILDFVIYSNRNLQPVENISETVQRSLKNFMARGIIKKDKKHIFRINHNRIPPPEISISRDSDVSSSN